MGWDVDLLRQPKTLETMALKKLGDWITSQTKNLATPIRKLQLQDPTKASLLLKESLSKQIETIRNHIECKLPRMFHDEAMVEAKQSLFHLATVTNTHSEVIPDTMIGAMLEPFFTKHLTCFSLNDLEWARFKDAFNSKLYLLTGITKLTLTITDVSTNDILNRIVDNCKLIETLELSSPDINDDCIKILIKLNNLRSIDVRETSVSETGVKQLLLSCANIEHIGTNVDIAQIIDDMVYFGEQVGKLYKLKFYENGPETTPEQLQLVVQMCPLIQKVKLLKEDDIDWQNYLNPLNDLQDLRELKLYFCQFYSERVKQLLQAKGPDLVEIRFCQVLEIDFSALKYIYLTCPNLQSLTLRKCQFVEGMWEEDPFPCKAEISPLKHMTRINVTGFNSWRPDDHLIFLLSHCPNIEYIDISGIATLHEHFILELLEKDRTNLMYLRELRIRRKLSRLAIEEIVRNCVNSPVVIARQP